MTTATWAPPPLGSTEAKDDAESVAAVRPAHLAVIDILDRDGQVRQSHPVHAWPLSIGRSLENHLVLTDPHVAPHHLVIGPDDSRQLVLTVADTRNGVSIGRERLHQGERRVLGGPPPQSPIADSRLSNTVSPAAPSPGPAELTVGRTRLRLHLPDQAVAAELPLAANQPLTRRLTPVAVAAAVLLAMQAFSTYLSSDADGLGRAVGGMLMTSLAGAVVWCGAWSLLSKTFTRQAYFGWHLRTFLFGSIGLLLLNSVPAALAFAFSWPAVTDFAFIGSFLVGGVAIYFHLLAVEPARPRLLRGVVATGVLTGIALTLWLNVTRTDLYGEELYMSHLLPPGMRLVKPVPVDRFVAGLASLKPVLDKKAKEVDTSDPGPAGSGDGDE